MGDPILITGAGGKTGRAIVLALVRQGHAVRALVRRSAQGELFRGLPNIDVRTGDMTEAGVLARAMAGARDVYHICPNVHPLELEIGQAAIEAATSQGVDRFVYHSVLHPAIEEMPHHWLKHEVELCLASTSLQYTVLQPCAYMQNVLGQRDRIVRSGEFAVPYSIDSGASLVDMRDVAAAAVEVLVGPARPACTYALCGPEPITTAGLASILTGIVHRHVRAVRIDIEEWRVGARAAGLEGYRLEALGRMFDWYDGHDFVGSPTDLTTLLDRPPTAFEAFVRREFSASGG